MIDTILKKNNSFACNYLLQLLKIYHAGNPVYTRRSRVQALSDKVTGGLRIIHEYFHPA
jgi:hypothetical protein